MLCFVFVILVSVNFLVHELESILEEPKEGLVDPQMGKKIEAMCRKQQEVLAEVSTVREVTESAHVLNLKTMMSFLPENPSIDTLNEMVTTFLKNNPHSVMNCNVASLEWDTETKLLKMVQEMAEDDGQHVENDAVNRTVIFDTHDLLDLLNKTL